MRKGNIYIGTSGWSNANWKGIFYPPEVKSKDFLKFFATQYNASEINTTFYHLPRVSTVEGWIERVPKDYKFLRKDK
jgi:uncharacterized protein YecE (DUF72 family)